jgi:molecular chaperone GrpE
MSFMGKNRSQDPTRPGRDPEDAPQGDAAGQPGAEAMGGLDDQGLDEAAAKLQADLDELDSKYKRTLADFQNYQRRALQNESEAKTQGTAGAVRAILPVIDHFDLALQQDPSKVSAAQIFGGVKVIRDEFNRVLAALGVAPIVPVPNDEFDPMRHEAVMQQPAEGVAPGHVTATLQTGYAFGGRTLRPAKVSVAPTS